MKEISIEGNIAINKDGIGRHIGERLSFKNFFKMIKHHFKSEERDSQTVKLKGMRIIVTQDEEIYG